MKFWPLIVLAVACVMAPAAFASTITWDFATASNASLGSKTHTYTEDGISITATGSKDLYYKVDGGDETGLGLVGESDHEIEKGQSIVLNLGGLFSKDVTGLTLTLGSIQKGEVGYVCDAFADCMKFDYTKDFKPVSIMKLYSDMIAHGAVNGQLTVTACKGDVLIDQLQATATVPEPSSLLLMGSGVLAMAGVVRRKLRL
ncbi:MAG: PEP-CTERM sorting domain-containing protein [Terriglobales bacterium]|jgi:hypothetical protein